jgi:hypothetical protein
MEKFIWRNLYGNEVYSLPTLQFKQTCFKSFRSHKKDCKIPIYKKDNHSNGQDQSRLAAHQEKTHSSSIFHVNIESFRVQKEAAEMLRFLVGIRFCNRGFS